MSTYDSNEAMYAKVKLLRGKDYDVVVPSTYFVENLRSLGARVEWTAEE